MENTRKVLADFLPRKRYRRRNFHPLWQIMTSFHYSSIHVGNDRYHLRRSLQRIYIANGCFVPSPRNQWNKCEIKFTGLLSRWVSEIREWNILRYWMVERKLRENIEDHPYISLSNKRKSIREKRSSFKVLLQELSITLYEDDFKLQHHKDLARSIYTSVCTQTR